MVVMSYIRVVSNPPNPPLRSSVSHNEIATPMIVCIHLIYFIMRSIEHKAHVWLTLDSNPVTFAVAAAVAVDTFKCITRVGLPGSMHTTTVYYNAVRSVPRSSIGVHAFLLRSHTEPALGFERCPAVCIERFATTFHLFHTTNIIGARRHVTEQQRQVRSLRAGVSACKCRNRKSRTCRHARPVQQHLEQSIAVFAEHSVVQCSECGGVRTRFALRRMMQQAAAVLPSQFELIMYFATICERSCV